MGFQSKNGSKRRRVFSVRTSLIGRREDRIGVSIRVHGPYGPGACATPRLEFALSSQSLLVSAQQYSVQRAKVDQGYLNLVGQKDWEGSRPGRA